MKIYLFTFTFYPENNGVANVVLNQAKHFVSQGHDVYVITSPNKDRNYNANSIKHLTIKEFDIKGSFKLYNFYRGEVSKYIQFLKTMECDVAFFHCWQIWSTDLLFFIDTRHLNYKTVVVSHCTGVNSSKTLMDKVNKILFYPYRMVMKSIMKKVDKLVFLSNKIDLDRFYDATIVYDLGLEHKKVVIPNGVENIESEKLNDTVLKNYDLSNINYLVYVSNYQKIKNQELALEVFENLSCDCDIVFIGGYKSKYLDVLKAKQHKSKKKRKIHFLVDIPRNDMMSIVFHSRLFIFTSSNECAPLSVLEPLSLGVPVVSSDVGNVRNLGGAIVEDNVDGFVNTIDRLMNDDNAYKIQKKIVENIRHTYDWSNAMEKYDLLIQEVCNEGKRC